MKEKIMFTIGMIAACILAYFSGYYGYLSHSLKTEFIEPLSVQHSIQLGQDAATEVLKEYYIGKIEQDVLLIYKMPEQILYESVNMDTLHVTETEKEGFIKGKIFADLSEVFEFLENSMS